MTALEKSTRRKLYYGMLALFLLVVPLVILYSRGYVVDWRGQRFVPTGGIFVKTTQPGSRVFLGDTFTKETSFILRGALLTGLLPGRYTVRVEKDGYQPWLKVVRVRSEEVIEFRNIFLPPATITPQALFNAPGDPPVRLEALEGRPEIAVELGDPAKGRNLFIVDPEVRLARINLPRIAGWRWDKNGGELYFGRRREGRTLWYRLKLDPGTREERITFRGLPEGFSAQDLTPHPTRAGQFYFFAGGALFLQTAASVPAPITEQVHAYTVAPNHIYFISKNGYFVETSLEGRNTVVLGRKGLVLDEARPARFSVSAAGAVAVLDSANGLFLYRPGLDQELQFIAANVEDLDFSESGDRMVYWDQHRVWLYWIQDNRRQPFQVAGSREQILSTVEGIRRAFLVDDGSHLFYATSAGLHMSEVDSRSTPNIYDLIEASVTDAIFKREAATLFWTAGKLVYRASIR